MPRTSTPSREARPGDGAQHRQAVVAVGVEHAAAQTARCRARRSRPRSPRCRRRGRAGPRPRRRSGRTPSRAAPARRARPSRPRRSSRAARRAAARRSPAAPPRAPRRSPRARRAATSRSLTGSCAISSPVSSSRSPSTIPCIRRRIRRKPVRVQLTPTSRISSREPGTSTPAATRNAAELGSPGTPHAARARSSSALTTVTLAPVAVDRDARPQQHPLGVVAAALGLADGRGAVGGQRREQHARLDLGARDRQL